MTPWERATTALQLLRLDPDHLGGLVLHARSGCVRDCFTAMLPDDVVSIHPAMPQDVLTGGIDVARSLSDGALVHQRGLLEGQNQLWRLSMAERTPQLLAGTLSAALEKQQGNALIALDEHTEDEAGPPAPLMERLAFHVSLEGLGLSDVRAQPEPNSAQTRPCIVKAPESASEELVALSVTLGIDSLRAPFLALCAARAHAALHGRTTITTEDVIVAAELVLAPRATQMPQQTEEPQESAPEPQPEQPSSEPSVTEIPQELILEAIATALPHDLLSKTGSNTCKNASGSGAGQKRVGNRKGRPLPPRNGGIPNGSARVDMIATLRAAVPWQKRRRDQNPNRTGPIIHPSDLRYKRYEDLSDRLLIFAVDASGSAALSRLAEAKGAVELLLAEAYARRDHVSLISFRGTEAEVLLPPTRSLVQTKRRLADLPGGGGTPLASGLMASLEAALHSGRKGLSPVIILLTDGRSNVALDGSANRRKAAEDAQGVALQIAQHGIDSLVIDCGKRPEKSLATLALSLRGTYISLPRADARAVSETVSATLVR